MRLAIRHTTLYTYASPFIHSIQQLRLTPRAEPEQRVLDWALRAPAPLDQSLDAFGNQMHTLTLAKPGAHIQVAASGLVETLALDGGRLAAAGGHWVDPLVFTRPTAATTADAAILDFARAGLAPGAGADALIEFAAAVCRQVRYRAGVTEVTSTARDAFALGQGVCQDQAHLYLAACHVAGLPCRYVSGYFYPGEKPELASHAWVDVWLADRARTGGGDWISVDVTHACFASERYVRLAVGRDYETSAPVRGMRTGGGEEALSVSVSVARAD